jgi:hypothetical protein
VIETMGWDDTTPDESKVLANILELRSDDLGMADGEGLVFQDVGV